MSMPAAIAWDELHSKDRDRAEAFYHTLFGWTSTPVEMSPDYSYHLLERAGNGQMFGGAHQQGPDEAGQPSFWLISLGTDDVDAVTAKASELGATVIMEPADIPGTGRFSLLGDPLGAPVGVLSYSDGRAAPDRGEANGCIVWHELISSDPARSGAFYSALFGFDFRASDMEGVPASVFWHGDSMVADVLPKPTPSAPDAWIFYVAVENVQNTLELAVDAGGSVTAPPSTVPSIGILAWLADPTGALFGIVELEQ